MSVPDFIVTVGDTVELLFQLFRNENECWDLTNYQIRFQVNDIKKATANVSGGSDDEINIIEPQNGKFIVTINAGELNKTGDFNYEIEIRSPEGKVYTVAKGVIRVVKQLITWDEK